MKLIYRIPLLLLLFGIQTLSAQDEALTKQYKEDVIARLSTLMNELYVFPEVAKATEAHLLEQWEAGHFDQFEDNQAFADALTASVQSINKDKHMRIRVNPPFNAPPNSPERRIEERLADEDRFRRMNMGFQRMELLDGNVAYLDLRGFVGVNFGRPAADAYMQLMSRADAMIIDLSKNGGGSPAMVQYLCSYFFAEKLHLNSLYYRPEDTTEEYWTLDEVGGPKMPDLPLFIITSERTFSAAEEFSYNMQTQERATLVGQTTGGGANPGGERPLNEHLRVFIPTGRAINPITKTNWEGVGVVPEVAATPEDAFATAHALAKTAAEKYRQEKQAKYTEAYLALHAQLARYQDESSQPALLQSVSAINDAGTLGEEDFNNLGYEYLIEYKKPRTAIAMFWVNTQLYPESANVYDSYGEALLANGDVKASVASYQKAVDIATANEDDDLAFYARNLANAQRALEDK